MLSVIAIFPLAVAEQGASRLGERIVLYQLGDVKQKHLALCVGTKRDEWNNTLGYVFLGDARFVKHEGEKPISIM